MLQPRVPQSAISLCKLSMQCMLEVLRGSPAERNQSRSRDSVGTQKWSSRLVVRNKVPPGRTLTHTPQHTQNHNLGVDHCSIPVPRRHTPTAARRPQRSMATIAQGSPSEMPGPGCGIVLGMYSILPELPKSLYCTYGSSFLVQLHEYVRPMLPTPVASSWPVLRPAVPITFRSHSSQRQLPANTGEVAGTPGSVPSTPDQPPRPMCYGTS